jgi:hypothetical protein
MSFQAPYSITDMRRLQMAEAQQKQQMQQENMQAMTSQVFDALGQFAGQYADNKALEAKGGAYADFMKRHGEQLGFDPTYLEDFLKKKPRDQAMIGDSIIGMQSAGRQLMNQQYLQNQMSYGGGGGGGGGAGGMVRVPFGS